MRISEQEWARRLRGWCKLCPWQKSTVSYTFSRVNFTAPRTENSSKRKIGSQWEVANNTFPTCGSRDYREFPHEVFI